MKSIDREYLCQHSNYKFVKKLSLCYFRDEPGNGTPETELRMADHSLIKSIGKYGSQKSGKGWAAGGRETAFLRQEKRSDRKKWKRRRVK